MTENELYELLQQLGIEGLITRNNNIMGLCPFHEERSPSWGISVTEPHKHGCFSCGARGVLFDLLTRVGGYTKAKAGRIANVRTSGDSLIVIDSPIARYIARRLRTIDPTELYPYDWDERIADYLRSRGIPPEPLKRAGIVYHPKDNRMLFPWVHRQLVGVTGRALDDNKVKTLPYFHTQKGSHLYLPSGRILPNTFLVILEGELDAWKVFIQGHHNVAAVGFGSYTDAQINLTLNSGVREVCLFFDDDETGQRLTELAKRKLQGIKVSEVDYSPFRKLPLYRGKKLDPGELSFRHIHQALTNRSAYASWQLF